MCKSASLLLISFFFVIALTGCATSVGEPGKYTSYMTEKAPLLEEGPEQTIPATKSLSAGTRIHIVSLSGTYVYVESIYGDKGWVPASAVENYDPSEADPTPRSGHGISW